MNIRRIGLGVFAGVAAFVLGFEIGMGIYVQEPFLLVIPTEMFAGAFPRLRAWFPQTQSSLTDR